MTWHQSIRVVLLLIALPLSVVIFAIAMRCIGTHGRPPYAIKPRAVIGVATAFMIIALSILWATVASLW